MVQSYTDGTVETERLMVSTPTLYNKNVWTLNLQPYNVKY